MISARTMTTKVQKLSLDKLLITIMQNPRCLSSPFVICGLSKVLMNALTFMHMHEWRLAKLIPITLHILCCYRFTCNIGKRIISGESLQLSIIRKIGFLIAILGHLLRRYANRAIGEHDFSVDLVRDGPYHYVRHPRYAGVYLYGIGDCMFYQNYYIYCALFIRCIVYPRFMIEEEQKLEDFFGEEYAEYKQQVPHRVIPGVL